MNWLIWLLLTSPDAGMPDAAPPEQTDDEVIEQLDLLEELDLLEDLDLLMDESR